MELKNRMVLSALSIIIILTAALLTGALTFTSTLAKLRRRGSSFTARACGKTLTGALSESLERGDAAHFDLSSGSSAMFSATAIPGLESANQIARRVAAADSAPVFTADDGFGGALLERAVRSGYRAVESDAEYEPTTVRTAGNDAVSHQAVTLTAIDETHEPMHLSVGSAGAEIALQDFSFAANESVLIAGDNLQAQAAGIVAAEETFIGERVFALPALVRKADRTAGPFALRTLIVMDAMRWIVIAALIIGVVFLRVFG